ncbi:MAG: hypothetical protein ACE5EH_01900 [Gammaproteobacteria bacterium]
MTATAVTFTSSCVGSSTATLDSPVNSVNGIAISTYVATGCNGNDLITASAVVDGVTISATATLNVQPATAGSIVFVSATPESIALQGTGGAGLSETSTVVFQVKDTAGANVVGQTVSFSLNTTVGGLSIVTTSATTNAKGEVQTVVQSGTVPTAVRVTASVDGASPAIETQSDQLVVSTGIPDQNSISLGTTVLNPEAWGFDGETSVITARLADRYNNPVPDGTAVSFTAEGGSIESSCTTVDGKCDVIWTSQAERPCGETLGLPSLQSAVTLNNCLADGGGNNPAVPQPGTAPLGHPYAGRVTIVATAVGEESFIDVNGNGVFDDGDSFTDLPEAYLDIDESDTRETNEIFFDFDQDQTYDAADGKFNGVLCAHSTLCSTKQTIHVRQKLVLVMSGSDAYIKHSPSITIPYGGAGTDTLYFSDLHNQPLPSGTHVTFTVGAVNGTIKSGDLDILSTNKNGATAYNLYLESAKPTNTQADVVFIEVKTPKGVVTRDTIPVIAEGTPKADLAITSVIANADPVAAGTNLTYTIGVINNGPDNATGVSLTTVTPSGLTIVTTSAGCFGDPVVCNIGNLANGATQSVTITYDTSGITPPVSLTFTASVTATETDNSTLNNDSGAFTQVN